LVHGIYRASTPEIRQRRRNFIDELKRHVPVHSVTDATGELMGRVSGEQAAKGIRLPFDDLAIGASALEQGYGVATLNARHFEMIPDLIVKRF
jgi:predicted nucleic acid-binding protein